MASAISTPPDDARTFSTELERDDYGAPKYAGDPAAALLPVEVRDLRWFYCEAESDMGIRSTFGRQLDAALAQRISDEAASDARAVRALRTRLQKGWRPKRRALRRAKRSAITEAMLEHVGADLPDEGVAQTQRISPERLDLGDLSEQTIYMRSPLRTVVIDPYESEAILKCVGRANRIRARLVVAGDAVARVLHAVYGPATFGQERKALAKRFGDLVEVVVAIMAAKREPSDPPARATVIANLHNDAFVRTARIVAENRLRAAAEAYAETRSAIVRALPSRPRCEPIYGPGPVGHRAFLGYRWR